MFYIQPRPRRGKQRSRRLSAFLVAFRDTKSVVEDVDLIDLITAALRRPDIQRLDQNVNDLLQIVFACEELLDF